MRANFPAVAGILAAMLFSGQASATIVRVQTALGSFDVNLYDRTTPATVANFLSYVNSGAYANMFFHRSVGGFVLQGGGYRYTGPGAFESITANAPVTNEPIYSNVRGTISMAKVSGNANSATNQWFINTGNNSANLDVQNGGFTAFGQVVGSGMTVVDAINALQVFAPSTTFDSLPLRNYTTQNSQAGVQITDQHLIITTVTVVDSSPDTAAGLSPTPNTLINQPPTNPGGLDPDEGGGGATGLGSLLLLGLLALLRQRKTFAAAIR
jgi:cyclophilin family peptidyl-prolyl cis-trans isomerase